MDRITSGKATFLTSIFLTSYFFLLMRNGLYGKSDLEWISVVQELFTLPAMLVSIVLFFVVFIKLFGARNRAAKPWYGLALGLLILNFVVNWSGWLIK
jgi:hypothetical protein